MIKTLSRLLLAGIAAAGFAFVMGGTAQASPSRAAHSHGKAHGYDQGYGHGNDKRGPKVTVTEGATSFTVTDGAVGSLVFDVDPSTGAISSPVATAGAGYTAGTPTIKKQSVSAVFTPTSGKPVTLTARLEREDGQVSVTANEHSGSDGAATNRGGKIVISQAATGYTVTEAHVGTLSFTFDPSTSSFSGVTATADPSSTYTAGTPAITGNVVSVSFTSPSAKTQTLVARVVVRNGSIAVRAHGSRRDDD